MSSTVWGCRVPRVLPVHKGTTATPEDRRGSPELRDHREIKAQVGIRDPRGTKGTKAISHPFPVLREMREVRGLKVIRGTLGQLAHKAVRGQLDRKVTLVLLVHRELQGAQARKEIKGIKGIRELLLPLPDHRAIREIKATPRRMPEP